MKKISRIIRSWLIIIIVVVAIFVLFPHQLLCHQSNGRCTDHCASDSYTNSNRQARGLGLIVQLRLKLRANCAFY